MHFENKWFIFTQNKRIKKKRPNQQLLTQVHMLINEQIKHLEISQKLLR